jgi:hypothetical protein
MRVFTKLEEGMQASFLSIGLIEDQEKEMLNLLGEAEKESEVLFEKSRKVNHELKTFMNNFNELKG